VQVYCDFSGYRTWRRLRASAGYELTRTSISRTSPSASGLLAALAYFARHLARDYLYITRRQSRHQALRLSHMMLTMLLGGSGTELVELVFWAG